MQIDWDAFKEHKQFSVRKNNFEILLEFFKSYYNIHNPNDIFEALMEDPIGEMMLNKRNIKDAEALENILFKI